MRFAEYRYLVFSDLYRIHGQATNAALLHELMMGESFKFNFWLRTCSYLRKRRLLRLTLYPFARFMLGHMTYKLGISIPAATHIGSGFYIGHFGGIVISHHAVIGRNCNISQGVTIGASNRGKHTGAPTIGDSVYIGPGAKIFGAVKIGNRVAIGANCVVTKDVPDNAVVVGIPGRVISHDGSAGYVNLVDYDLTLQRLPSP